MDITSNEKISFIPKGSLVREESFFERSRPRSIMGIIAIAVFVVVLGSFIGLSFYENYLAKQVVTKTAEIEQAQKLFDNAPQVGEARLFSMRANLVKSLISSHTVVSPIFSFLTQNTLGSIFYSRFTFSKGVNGQVLEVQGEAPTYAALAYQADILRERMSNELKNFDVKDIILTKFGTITFTLVLTFSPEYLSYEKSLASGGSQVIPFTSSSTQPVFTPASTSTNIGVPATSTSLLGAFVVNPEIPVVDTTINNVASSTVAPVPVRPLVGTAESGKKQPAQPSRSLFDVILSKLKFW